MNLLNVPSLNVCLRIVVVTCEVVNYYNVYKYLCYYYLSMCSHVRISTLSDVWVRSYRVGVSVLSFRRPFVFDTFPFELVRFRYTVSPYSYSCSTCSFFISFSC